MATFKYIGECNGPFEMYGATWDHGKTASVDNPDWVRRLEGNRFFERVPDDVPAPAPKKQPKPRKDVKTDDNAEPPTTE